MNRFYLISLVLLGCFSCSQKEQTVTGIVCEATMNTLSIVPEAGDTLFFSTLDADKTEVNGLLLDDTAKVFFRGKYTRGMSAAKIIVYPQSNRTLIGGDKNEHGCIGSAGYTWSEVRKECIRLFESGIRVKSIKDDQSAFIVFSKDSTLAELFLPSGVKAEILERRTLPTGKYVWNKKDDDTPNIKFDKGKWTISRRNKLIYRQEVIKNNEPEFIDSDYMKVTSK